METMRTVRLLMAGRAAEVRIDPAADDVYYAVVADDGEIWYRVTARLDDAAREGTELTPTGPLWRHRVAPWSDERELAIALADYLDPDDPLAAVRRDDPELAELTRVPEGAIA
jgi:hypothetical protein